jgi:hypothetical protein
MVLALQVSSVWLLLKVQLSTTSEPPLLMLMATPSVLAKPFVIVYSGTPVLKTALFCEQQIWGHIVQLKKIFLFRAEFRFTDLFFGSKDANAGSTCP